MCVQLTKRTGKVLIRFSTAVRFQDLVLLALVKSGNGITVEFSCSTHTHFRRIWKHSSSSSSFASYVTSTKNVVVIFIIACSRTISSEKRSRVAFVDVNR